MTKKIALYGCLVMCSLQTACSQQQSVDFEIIPNRLNLRVYETKIFKHEGFEDSLIVYGTARILDDKIESINLTCIDTYYLGNKSERVYYDSVATILGDVVIKNTVKHEKESFYWAIKKDQKIDDPLPQNVSYAIRDGCQLVTMKTGK